MNFSLSMKNIKGIPFQKYNKDFTFIVNGKRYITPRIVADILSPKVRKLHFTDSSMDEFYFETSNKNSTDKSDEEYFEDFLKLYNFDQIQLDENHRRLYSSYFYKLGNINEYFRLDPDYLKPISTDNAISRLHSILEASNEISEEIDRQIINIDEIISFIASHFEEISKEEMGDLPVEILLDILKSPNLKLLEEDSLLKFVIKLYAKDHLYSQLFSLIQLNNVSESMLESFIQTIKFEDVNCELWKSICGLVVKKSEIQKSDNSRYHQKKIEFKEFKYENGHEFEGIMRYLTTKTGGNIHDNKTIEITTNSITSESKHPRNVVDYQRGNIYDCENISDVFICFDFKDKRIQPSKYSLQTSAGGVNRWHLRNWAIEVSNDGKKWEEIDRHSNDSTLNGASIKTVFNVSKVPSDFYRFIRLHQTGYSWLEQPNSNKYGFELYYIDFFGKLVEK